MSDDGGKSFQELKEEYESGDADWSEDDFGDDLTTDDEEADDSAGNISTNASDNPSDNQGDSSEESEEGFGDETFSEDGFEEGAFADASEDLVDEGGSSFESELDEASGGGGGDAKQVQDMRGPSSRMSDADYFDRMCSNALARFGFREVACKTKDGRYMSKYKPPSALAKYLGEVLVTMKQKGSNKILFKMTSNKGGLDHSGRIDIRNYVKSKERNGNKVYSPTQKRMFLEMSLKRALDPYIQKAKEDAADDEDYEFGQGNVDPQVEQQLSGGDRF